MPDRPDIDFTAEVDGQPLGFYWWHHCPPMSGTPGYKSLRWIDTGTGARHAVLGGSLAGGDLTIGGGSGSIPCPAGCGLHGWVRNGRWEVAG